MTTKELYDALICKPDLHSIPELYDNVLIWHLYRNAYVQAYCDNGSGSIDIINNSIFTGSVTHWHPDEADMLEELYALGKIGHMLVVKKSLYGTSLFYIGPSEQYQHPNPGTFYFGKKKYDSGQLIYFEQK